MAAPQKRVIALLCVSIAYGATLAVPQETRPAKPPPRGTADLKAEVEREAHRLEKANLSVLFTSLSNPGVAGELGLTGDQRDLIQRLEALTRGVTQGWLLRGLDGADTKGLAERLSDRGVQLRREIVSHAETMIVQGILTSDQLVRLRLTSDRSALSAPKASGNQPEEKRRRSTERSTTSAPSREEVAKLRSTVEAEARGLYINSDHVSDYFSSLANAHQQAELGLSSEQQRWIGELDELTRSIIRGWLLRGLDSAKPPSDLVERLSENGIQRRGRIVARAEAIARLGILTPIQAEQSKRRLWQVLGSRALQDPELASRLRLTREQKGEVADRIANKRRVTQVADETLGRFRALGSRNRELARQADREIRGRISEAEGLIWDVLDPIQLDKLEEILNTPVRSARRRR